MSSKIIYFSKMFQAVPHLAQLAAALPGVFVSSRTSTLSATKSLYPALPCARYSRWFPWLAKGNRLLREAELIVTGSPYKSFLQDYTAKKCTVFHGTYMLLSKDALRRNAHFDLLCAIGPRMQRMIERFADEIPVNSVATGFLPFGEYPEQSPAARLATLARLDLSPENRTLIYTPNRRGIGSWEMLAEQLLRRTPPGFNLVLRPHPSQALTSRRKDRASFRRIGELAQARGNARLDLTSLPLPELFSVADLIISDGNSPTEESLFYDLPQLLIECPTTSRSVLARQAGAEQAHPDDIAQLLSLYDCGPIFDATGNGDLAQAVENAITDAAHYAAQRQRYFSWVFGARDRRANERVSAAIKQHLLN